MISGSEYIEASNSVYWSAMSFIKEAWQKIIFSVEYTYHFSYWNERKEAFQRSLILFTLYQLIS